ncbi:MAG: hypothetical protein CO128_05490 [Ignavibacteriales bacterium CG_4_9_14_3_um_filter_30_11]|nr:MAG: hypothetical protein CO128_05490 [Ignavibacteriales bacterium CG_4_9_14_3_um_filter_30_11]
MKTKIKYLTVLLTATIFYLTGCVNSSNSPITGISNAVAGKIEIYSPVTGDSVGYDRTIINYSVFAVQGNKSVELYINGKYVSTYFTNDPKTAFELKFDPSLKGQTFSYYLKYYDANGASAISDTMTNIVITEPRVVPNKPTDIKLMTLQGPTSNSINISWSDNSIGEVYYEVWRREITTPNYTRQIGPLPPHTFNVNDNNILPNVVYYYKVRGINKFGNSEFSDEVNTAGASGSGSFPPPTGLSAVAISSNVVKLQWQDNSNNENFFKIERNDNWSAWSTYETISTVSANITTFTDNSGNLIGGHEYYYRVKAFSSSDSSWSNIASVKTPL